jgi:16S rRNA (guanine966-N2)-methyltransferase
MRVIAGSARGRRLKAPPGRGTRPTSDRVREALFSSLGDDIVDVPVLDLFAGTGALGIEALSRGAASATFVERDPSVLRLLRDNLAAAGVDDRAVVIGGEAAAFVRRLQTTPFAVVFCDPPYDTPLDQVLDLVARLHAGGGLAAGATVVVERDRRDPHLANLDAPHGLLAADRQRSYGDTVLVYLRPKVA